MVALHDSLPVREALRSQLACGTPVVTLMSGIDNLQAGRTAGHFIGRLAHTERMRGCADVLAERHPQLLCSDPVPCLDDPAGRSMPCAWRWMSTGYVDAPAPNEFRLFCAENLGRSAYLAASVVGR